MEFLVLLALMVLLLIAVIERLNGRAGHPVLKFQVRFNGERLAGQCLVIDARTPQQRQRNERAGQLDGDVLVFMHGHGQSPGYGYRFLSMLAQRSRSGILVVPWVHTPCGLDPRWRGDQGKMPILLEIARWALADKGIELQAEPLREAPPVTLIPRGSAPESGPGPAMVRADRASAVGWSHGGLVARRFAHSYPGLVRGLAQLTPAGFESWGEGLWSTFYLLVNFLWEALLIALGLFRGEARPVLVAGWALIRGIGSDMLAGWASLLHSRPRLLPLFRTLYDVHQCARVMTDANAPVPHLDHLVVLYGRTDTVFEAGKAIPLRDPGAPTEEETRRFFQTYYPGTLARGARCAFKVLPGNHIAPMVYTELYVEETLRGLGQLGAGLVADEAGTPSPERVRTSS